MRYPGHCLTLGETERGKGVQRHGHVRRGSTDVARDFWRTARKAISGKFLGQLRKRAADSHEKAKDTEEPEAPPFSETFLLVLDNN